MSSNRAPTTAEGVRLHIDGALADLHTMIPAVVTAYDATQQRVSVQPLIKRFTTLPDGSRKAITIPVQGNIPVHFMSAGGFSLTCPISDGTLIINAAKVPATIGMLVTAEASLDVWKSGQGQLVDPQFDERFQMKDAVFVPGLNPFGNPLAGVAADEMFAGVVGALGIHWTPTLITIGDHAGSKKIVLDGDPAAGGTWQATCVAGVSVTLTYISANYTGATGVTLVFVFTPAVSSVTGTINGVPFAIGLTVATPTGAVSGGVTSSATQANAH